MNSRLKSATLGPVTINPSREPASGTRVTTRAPRRAPSPEERRRDADNSRRLLLAAALDEFAEKGFAGARVQDIAARAGVNKQLINYYFDSKEGLYRSLQELWLQRETEFASPSLALSELVVRYLHDTLSEPRMTRLLLWHGLAAEAEIPVNSAKHEGDLERMRSRKAGGELAPELDSGAVLVALMGAVTAPVATPQRVQMITGMDPTTPEFEEFYADQLRRMVRLLAGCPHHDHVHEHDGDSEHDGHSEGEHEGRHEHARDDEGEHDADHEHDR